MIRTLGRWESLAYLQYVKIHTLQSLSRYLEYSCITLSVCLVLLLQVSSFLTLFSYSVCVYVLARVCHVGRWMC